MKEKFITSTLYLFMLNMWLSHSITFIFRNFPWEPYGKTINIPQFIKIDQHYICFDWNFVAETMPDCYICQISAIFTSISLLTCKQRSINQLNGVFVVMWDFIISFLNDNRRIESNQTMNIEFLSIKHNLS